MMKEAAFNHAASEIVDKVNHSNFFTLERIEPEARSLLCEYDDEMPGRRWTEQSWRHAKVLRNLLRSRG